MQMQQFLLSALILEGVNNVSRSKTLYIANLTLEYDSEENNNVILRYNIY